MKKTIYLLLILPVIIILILQQFTSSYYISSLYKLIFLTPLLFRLRSKSFKESILQNFSKIKKIKSTILFGIIYVVFYGGAYLVFSESIGNISGDITTTLSITAQNIIFIGLYIIIFNSLLEEFFWRGFVFDELKNTKYANILTGIAFSFHHVVFFYTWLSIPLILLSLLGLTIFAVMQNYLFLKTRNISNVWISHIFADVVQILIGLKIFGIL